MNANLASLANKRMSTGIEPKKMPTGQSNTHRNAMGDCKCRCGDCKCNCYCGQCKSS